MTAITINHQYYTIYYHTKCIRKKKFSKGSGAGIPPSFVSIIIVVPFSFFSYL
ncbi:hypothetical protein glysoja_026283 [Glycine soja]|uniref:Uncharacterized protein n=1 Tax=Glycine soja TaxID=3848 RepID=A0A0B2RJ87_GLYSO|nr:hypothetical protein glysoja_026283 [Glycine soja]